MVEEKARLYQIMANTDQLTQLYNRKYLDTLLRHEGIRAHRYETPLSLMLLDVDNFKRINDTFGHQVGDLVLRKVAKCLKQQVREVDVVGRWGGEEFMLVCPNTTLDDAFQLAEKLRLLISELTFQQDLQVTVSIGVAQMQKGERTEQTIARADVLMYKAKNNGRNRVYYN